MHYSRRIKHGSGTASPRSTLTPLIHIRFFTHKTRYVHNLFAPVYLKTQLHRSTNGTIAMSSLALCKNGNATTIKGQRHSSCIKWDDIITDNNMHRRSCLFPYRPAMPQAGFTLPRAGQFHSSSLHASTIPMVVETRRLPIFYKPYASPWKGGYPPRRM